MKHVFAVRDSAVDCYISPPLFMQSRGEALRAFQDACQNPQHEFYKHARDYELFYLGTFDDTAGVFQSRQPESVIRAIDCLTQAEDVSRNVP